MIATTVFTKQRRRLTERWKLEGGLPRVSGQRVDHAFVRAKAGPRPDLRLTWRKEHYVLLPEGEIGPVATADTDYSGLMVVYDWETKQIVWRSNWGDRVLTPSGFCFADGALYLNDLEGANIFLVDVDREPGRLLKRISHPYLNDLHSLERTRRGLLVSCSGNDALVELDLDGNLLWEWWAAEHGYRDTPSGQQRESGRGLEHRDRYYHTMYQSTHVNTAAMRDDTERRVLALLFHQGQLIQIDRDLSEERQDAQVLLEGLARPHTLEKLDDGWLCCNTLGKELLLLDADLRIAERIPYDGGWIQDATRLSNGHLLLNDVDGSRLVEIAGPPYEIVAVVPYDPNWRMAEIAEVPERHRPAFRRAGNVPSAPDD